MYKITVEAPNGNKTTFNDVLDYSIIDRNEVEAMATNMVGNMFPDSKITHKYVETVIKELETMLQEDDDFPTETDLCEHLEYIIKQLKA